MSFNHADNLDTAQEYQQMGIDIAIQNARSNLPPPLTPEEKNKIIYRTCEECGNEIPLARVRALNARLCVECARALELENKSFRGYHHD